MPRTKKKVKSIVKTKVISARVTETTHELLHQQAEDAGMTLSEFAAQMLMKGRVNYIISFDPRDSTENCLTGKRAQELGLEYAKANFPGHQALVCTHMDGHNGSGNIHVHIVINSLRKLDVPQQPFMERPIDCKAGYKHHVTNEYLKHLQKSLMDLCQREFLHQVDLLSPSRTGVTEAEYWAQRRLNEKKQEIEKERFFRTGGIPKHLH